MLTSSLVFQTLKQNLFSFSGFWSSFWQITVTYYLGALALHYAVPALFPVKIIQPRPPKKGDIARDILHSVAPIVVKAFYWKIVELLYQKQWSYVYVGSFFKNRFHEVLYCMFVILVLDLLHDSWFYWTHRLLHWAPLYRGVHLQHHLSRAPTAFTGYSFHVVEALIVFFDEVTVCFLLPVNLRLHRVYHLLTTLYHQAGHAGYEITPFVPSLEGLISLLLSFRIQIQWAPGVAVNSQSVGSKSFTTSSSPNSPLDPFVSDSVKMNSLQKRSKEIHVVARGPLGEMMEYEPSVSLKDSISGDDDDKNFNRDLACNGSNPNHDNHNHDDSSTSTNDMDSAANLRKRHPSTHSSFDGSNSGKSTPCKMKGGSNVDNNKGRSNMDGFSSVFGLSLPKIHIYLLPAYAMNTVQHHDLHHRYPNRHFSLYFTHWDRWCGTMVRQYDQMLYSYFSRPQEEGAIRVGEKEKELEGDEEDKEENVGRKKVEEEEDKIEVKQEVKRMKKKEEAAGKLVKGKGEGSTLSTSAGA